MKIYPQIKDYLKPSDRIKKLKEKFINYDSYMCCQRALIYTEVYKRDANLPLVIIRANALNETLGKIDLFLEEGDLILGNPASKPRSAEVFPEMSFHWIEELDDFETREYNRLKVLPEVKETLIKISHFWKGKIPSDWFQALRSEDTRKCFDAGLLSNPHEFSTLAHVGLDYGKILEKGIKGILKEIEEEKNKLEITSPDYHSKFPIYVAWETICYGIINYSNRYKNLLFEIVKEEKNSRRVKELNEMIKVLDRIPYHPAKTFHEAIQSFWFVQLISQIEGNGFSISPGRFDQYIYPYLENDLKNGYTLEKAIEILDCLWLKFAQIFTS